MELSYTVLHVFPSNWLFDGAMEELSLTVTDRLLLYAEREDESTLKSICMTLCLQHKVYFNRLKSVLLI